MAHNPYAAPKVRVDEGEPEFSLWASTFITVAVVWVVSVCAWGVIEIFLAPQDLQVPIDLEELPGMPQSPYDR